MTMMTTFEERLSRLEGVYDHLASKADVVELKADLQSEIAELRLELQKTNGRFDSIEAQTNSRFELLTPALMPFRAVRRWHRNPHNSIIRRRIIAQKKARKRNPQ